jgi:hypothetical protein
MSRGQHGGSPTAVNISFLDRAVTHTGVKILQFARRCYSRFCPYPWYIPVYCAVLATLKRSSAVTCVSECSHHIACYRCSTRYCNLILRDVQRIFIPFLVFLQQKRKSEPLRHFNTISTPFCDQNRTYLHFTDYRLSSVTFWREFVECHCFMPSFTEPMSSKI